MFSKGAMVHIEDKAALYAEVLRVLKPGGWFTAADWLWRKAPPRVGRRSLAFDGTSQVHVHATGGRAAGHDRGGVC